MKNITSKLLYLFILLLSQSSFSQAWQSEGSATSLDGLTSNTSQQHIAIDSNNNNYILVHKDTQSKNFVLKYDGTTWATLGPYIPDGTNPPSNTNRIHSIAIDDNDTVYVAYVDVSLTNKVAVKKWDGNAWVYVGSSNGIAINTSGITNIVLKTLNNDLYITYFVPSLGIVVGKYDSANSTWNLVGGFNIANNADELDLAIDSNETPYLVYRDLSNNSFATVKKFDGTNWVLVGNPTTTIGSLPKINIKSDDTPVIAYISVSGNALINVKEFNGTSWVNFGNSVPTSFIPYNMSDRDLGFVLDTNDMPYLVYTENTTDKLGKVITIDNASNNWIELPSSNVPTGTEVRDNSIALDNQNVLHYTYRKSLVTKCVVYNATLSNQDFEVKPSVALFPNPTSNFFSIETIQPINDVGIYNIQGKRVKSFTQSHTSYNIEDLTSGLYFVNIETKNGTITKKLIKN